MSLITSSLLNLCILYTCTLSSSIPIHSASSLNHANNNHHTNAQNNTIYQRICKLCPLLKRRTTLQEHITHIKKQAAQRLQIDTQDEAQMLQFQEAVNYTLYWKIGWSDPEFWRNYDNKEALCTKIIDNFNNAPQRNQMYARVELTKVPSLNEQLKTNTQYYHHNKKTRRREALKNFGPLFLFAIIRLYIATRSQKNTPALQKSPSSIWTNGMALTGKTINIYQGTQLGILIAQELEVPQESVQEKICQAVGIFSLCSFNNNPSPIHQISLQDLKYHALVSMCSASTIALTEKTEDHIPNIFGDKNALYTKMAALFSLFLISHLAAKKLVYG